MSTLTPRRAFGAFLVGILLVQAAWILALPAFRGIDEFDHVYKASAVVRGELLDDGPAPDGRGGLVPVPRSIVEAASAVCSWYSYTGHDNCHPVEDVGDGDVLAASSATAYDPAWYAVAGLPTLVLGGDTALYAMRVLGALVCALLLAWGAAITAGWARSGWPLLAGALAATPMLTYSTVVAAPNGVHYASAALLWAALAGVVRGRAVTPRLAVPVAVAGTGLVLTHTTGPMWLLLIALSVLPLLPLRQWQRLVVGAWRPVAAMGGVLVLVTLAGLAWSHGAGTNGLGPVDAGLPPLRVSDLVRSEVLWVVQGVGAFPMRNEPAPTAVYALWLIPLAGLVVLGVRAAGRRTRLALALLALIALTVPAVLTVLSYPSQGLAWQGRYSLPILLGFTMLSGLALDGSPSPRRPVVIVVGAMTALAVAVSVAHVARTETSGQAPGVPASAALPLGWLVVGLVAAVGALVPLVALLRSPARDRELCEVP